MKLKIVTALVLSLVIGSCNSQTKYLTTAKCRDPEHSVVLAGINLLPADLKSKASNEVDEAAFYISQDWFPYNAKKGYYKNRQRIQAIRAFIHFRTAVKIFESHESKITDSDMEKYQAVMDHLNYCEEKFSAENWDYKLNPDQLRQLHQLQPK